MAHSPGYALVIFAFWNKYSIVSILVYCTTINNLFNKVSNAFSSTFSKERQLVTLRVLFETHISFVFANQIIKTKKWQTHFNANYQTNDIHHH